MASKTKHFTLVLDKEEKTIITIISNGCSCEASHRKMLMKKYNITYFECHGRFYFTYPNTVRDITKIPKKYNAFKEDSNYIFINPNSNNGE